MPKYSTQFYSCCSHLEHRTSVKRSLSLEFLNLGQSVGLLGRRISSSQGRYLTQTQNQHTETSMPGLGFEPTILAFERAKTFHALGGAATVIGVLNIIRIVELKSANRIFMRMILGNSSCTRSHVNNIPFL
jgi:hypothetical protein